MRDGDIMEERNVLLDNEIKANFILAKIMVLTFFIGIVTLVLTLTGIFEQPKFDYWLIPMVLVEILFLAGVVLCKRYKGEPQWMKHLLITILIISVCIMNGLFSDSATLMMCIPVILSIRYFSGKYSLYVALASFAAFFLSAVWSANAGIPDLNVMEYPLGTVIRMEQTPWLSEAVEGIPYDHQLQITNTLLYDFLPDMMLFLAIATAAVFIAKHGCTLILRQQELTSKTARIDAELELAAKIQASALPRIFPAFPEHDEFDIHAAMTPAKEVGGDFYDFFMTDENHLCMVIGDVSGKGVPAALFMMSAKALIKSNAISGKAPSLILSDTNKALCTENDAMMFVTLWVGILELSTGKMTASNAGHEYPALMKSGRFDLYKDVHGRFAGYKAKEKYSDYEIQMEPGDRLFVYTDGIPEAQGSDTGMFGENRMIEALNESKDLGLEQMLKAVQHAVNTFVGNAEQFDDLTMLCVEYKGKTSVTAPI